MNILLGIWELVLFLGSIILSIVFLLRARRVHSWWRLMLSLVLAFLVIYLPTALFYTPLSFFKDVNDPSAFPLFNPWYTLFTVHTRWGDWPILFPQWWMIVLLFLVIILSIIGGSKRGSDGNRGVRQGARYAGLALAILAALGINLTDAFRHFAAPVVAFVEEDEKIDCVNAEKQLDRYYDQMQSSDLSTQSEGARLYDEYLNLIYAQYPDGDVDGEANGQPLDGSPTNCLPGELTSDPPNATPKDMMASCDDRWVISVSNVHYLQGGVQKFARITVLVQDRARNNGKYEWVKATDHGNGEFIREIEYVADNEYEAPVRAEDKFSREVALGTPKFNINVC